MPPPTATGDLGVGIFLVLITRSTSPNATGLSRNGYIVSLLFKCIVFKFLGLILLNFSTESLLVIEF